MSKNNKIIQSSLVSGILSEEAIGRLDYPKYYNGVAEANNMVVQTTGGMNKRAGFQHLASLQSEYRMFEFLFNTEDKYVVLIGEKSIKIWDIMNPTSKTFIDVENLGYLYTKTEAFELDFVQSADTMILTHGKYAPQKLVRYRHTDGSNTWKLEKIELKNIPQFNWDTNKHDAGASRVKKSKENADGILNLRDDILDAIKLGESVTPRIPHKLVDVGEVTTSLGTTTTTNTTERGLFTYPDGELLKTVGEDNFYARVMPLSTYKVYSSSYPDTMMVGYQYDKTRVEFQVIPTIFNGAIVGVTVDIINLSSGNDLIINNQEMTQNYNVYIPWNGGGATPDSGDQYITLNGQLIGVLGIYSTEAVIFKERDDGIVFLLYTGESRWGTKITIEEAGATVSKSHTVAWDELLSETIQTTIRNRITLKDTDYDNLDSDQLKILLGDDFTDEINQEINKVLGTWDKPLENIHDVWSNERGYPKYCTFYQNRLFFAGTPSKPLSVWGSVLNDYFNFDISESDADYAIADTINSNTLNHITGIYPSNVLQIYTSGSEYTNSTVPITPTTSAWTFQTGMGSHDNVSKDSLDGSTIFIDRSGAIRNFIYNYDSNSYLSKDLGLLAKQIIDDPQELVIIRSSQIDLSKLVYFRNKNGTLAVLNIDRNEQILSWTNWETNGEIVSIVGVDQSLFALVKKNGLYSFEVLNRREYSYNAKYNPNNDVFLDSYIERLGEDGNQGCADSLGGASGFDFNLDGTLGSCPAFVYENYQQSTIIDGLDFYNGTDVTVMLDKFYMGEYSVTNGSITVPRTFGIAQIGYKYEGTIKTLPLSSAQYGGQLDYNRVVKIVANFNKSSGITIDDQFISERDFDTYVFGSAPKEISGIREIYTLGWDRMIQFTIKSEYPYRMNLLSFTSYLDSNSAL